MEKQDKSILYVDDEQQNLDGFKFIFRRDYSIFTSIKISEAFEIIKTNDIKVLISDQRMPEMTGLEFISNIKKTNPDIVCIILTAYADMEAVIQAVNMGTVYRYMMKPWEEADLRLSINSALERYAYKKENAKLLDDIKSKNNELKRYNNELKETIEELKAAKEKAEESDRLKQAFLQNISHEIRTPMNGILGFADLLRTPGLDDKSRISYINTISSSGQQLISIIENVLDIAKIEAGQVELIIKETDLNYLLSDIFNFHKMQVEEDVDFFLENPYQNKPFIVNTDAVKLRQILDNLLQNARKFTIKGSITLKLIKEEDEVLFIVEDTGIGIPQDKLSSIFIPFRQIENEQSTVHSGTGLGLAITRSYVELFGGNIWVQSEENAGTQFFISLPLKANEESMQHKQKTDNDLYYFDNNNSVLVVEDDDVSYNYINTILLQMNLKTTRASSGNEAIALCRNHIFDAILMDIKLPDISGLEVTREIRNTGKTIPIIAQTSYALSNIRDEAFNAGCNDFITKPLLKKDLYNALRGQIPV